MQSIRASYYQQFDADPDAEVPGAAYGGWKEAVIDLDLASTAIVLMHAWDPGAPGTYPGWHRAVEYLSRVPGLADGPVRACVEAARAAGVSVIHVVADHVDYYSHLPGYRRAPDGFAHGRGSIKPSPATRALFAFREEHVFPGRHNVEDIDRAFTHLDFAQGLAPVGDEVIVATTSQLDDACRRTGIDHLVYIGFTINGCILINPCGMNDMQRLGYLCSTVADAVTAIENDATAATEHAKELALWYVALLYGFVLDSVDLTHALSGSRKDP